jgi:hypothetical protein
MGIKMRFIMAILAIVTGSATYRVLSQDSAGSGSGTLPGQAQVQTLAATLVPDVDNVLRQIEQVMWGTVRSLQEEQATPGSTPDPDAGQPFFWPRFLSGKNVERYIRSGKVDLIEQNPTGATATPGATPIVAAPTTTGAPKPAGQGVWPILEYVADNGDGTSTAYFGYENTEAQAVTIPLGPDNRFSPVPLSRGQPTTFQPGRSTPYPHASFSVVFEGGTLTWSLKGRTVTAVVFK